MSAPSSFRPELHGLRGLAIGLVVLYHVFFDRVSGGVDVFLFLSAYFLTGSFLRRMECGRQLAPLAHWARTFKRLLPPAAVVILATLLAGRLLLPPSTWKPALQDAIASLLQVQNWNLIQRGTDYEAAATTATSSLQHFWSLSIQGQVFLLWPVLFAACAALCRRTGLRPRRVLAGLFGTIAAGSFVWSVVSTADQQHIAYFDTWARMWEFAAGTLLALWPAAAPTAPAGPRRRALRVVLGWAGLAVLVGTGAVLDARSAFPGWVALIPLVGATGVLLAGSTGSRTGTDRLLASRPFRFLGDISYGLYLVHWPMLTIMLVARQEERADLLGGTLVIALSLVLAHLLTRFVDTPVRRWRWANARPARAGAVALLVLVLGLSPALAVQRAMHRAEAQAERRAAIDNPGAQVVDEEFVPHPDADPSAAPLPSAAAVSQDWGFLDRSCGGRLRPEVSSLAERCQMTEAPSDAKVLLVVGNSRVRQAALSLVGPATQNGWRVVLLHRNSCPFQPGVVPYSGQECEDHNRAVMDYLEQLQPDAVALSTTTYRGNRPEEPHPVLDSTVPDLLDAGLPVIALRASPRMPEDPNTCLERTGDERSCTFPLDREHMPERRPDQERLEELAAQGSLHPVDHLPLVCPDAECVPVRGNVRVFLDEDHVSATYYETAGTLTGRQLTATDFPW